MTHTLHAEYSIPPMLLSKRFQSLPFASLEKIPYLSLYQLLISFWLYKFYENLQAKVRLFRLS